MSLVFASEILKYVVFNMYDNTKSIQNEKRTSQKRAAQKRAAQKHASTNSVTKMNKNTVFN